jgi:hypothetical protein
MMPVASLAMAAMATACTVATLYGGEERPGMVAVGAGERGEVVVCFIWPVTDIAVRTVART